MAKRKWQREHIYALINCYQQYPLLYSARCKEYYDREKREAAFEHIAHEISKCRPVTTITEVRKKVKTLRSQYACEKDLHKRSCANETANGEPFRPRLWCYENLRFLDGHSHYKRKSSTRNTSGKSGQVSYPEDSDGNVIHPPWSDSNAESRCTQNQTEALIKTACEALQFARGVTVKEEDRHDILGKFVASEMRQITDPQLYLQTKRLIETAIMEAQEKTACRH